MIERVAIGHQGGRSQDAVAMRFDDPFVHIAREAEVVGIEDEPDGLWRRIQNATQNRVIRMVRNFLGFASKSLSTVLSWLVVAVMES